MPQFALKTIKQKPNLSHRLATWRPLGDLNPCCCRERAESWATRRKGQIQW